MSLNLCNVTHFVKSQNTREWMHLVQTSLFVFTYLSLIYQKHWHYNNPSKHSNHTLVHNTLSLFSTYSLVNPLALKHAFTLPNHPGQIYLTSMSPIALKCAFGLSDHLSQISLTSNESTYSQECLRTLKHSNHIISNWNKHSCFQMCVCTFKLLKSNSISSSMPKMH